MAGDPGPYRGVAASEDGDSGEPALTGSEEWVVERWTRSR